MRNVSNETIKLSLYVNGRYCESGVHALPYLKGTVIMLSLKTVALELGFMLDSNGEGMVMLYRDSVYDPESLTVRYIMKNNAVSLSYYSYKGQFLKLPPPEIVGEEIFVPIELLRTALGCDFSVSESGNINVRTVAAPARPAKRAEGEFLTAAT